MPKAGSKSNFAPSQIVNKNPQFFVPNLIRIVVGLKLVAERVTGTRNRIFGYPESAEKWVEGKLNKAFLNFCQIFVIFDDF